MSEIITMKEYYGVKDIISISEFSQFMWLYDKDYRKDYKNAFLQRMGDKLRAVKF